ncbi:MAG: hypothetical protein JXQ68_04220 [Campylobacterales bacterium]|nr:hypothetical protein [Campylobacterales bacterium]
MTRLMVNIHEVWLETLMAGFMASGRSKQILFDFSDILFRHFTWVEQYLIDDGVEYDYDRSAIPIKVEKLSTILADIAFRLRQIDIQLIVCNDDALTKRITSDINYIISTLDRLEDEDISAFDLSRKLDNYELTDEATDALTLFLFEESYKEYELIMIYNYLKVHTQDYYLIRIFQILIDESFFHLRSFGQMMADMGILGVPRIIYKELYKVENITEFLRNGINEEMLAKEECRKLSEAVGSESKELSSFFDCINMQEDYHIELMKRALEHFESRDNVK